MISGNSLKANKIPSPHSGQYTPAESRWPSSALQFNPAAGLLGLDFDGVIADSIAECLTVGYNAYRIVSGQPERIADLGQLPKTIQRESRRRRNYIRHGEDYVYIFRGISENRIIRNQNDFDRFLDDNQPCRDEYRAAFYAERSRFLREEPERWLALNPLYPGMAGFLQNFRPVKRLYIITTKKTEYVQAILNHAGITIAAENLLAADSRRSKSAIIGDILQKTGISPENFHFIDDQVDTLLKLQPLNIHLFLASWGYTNARQIAQAKAAGIQPLTLGEFFHLSANHN